jgi:hypothetical protein
MGETRRMIEATDRGFHPRDNPGVATKIATINDTVKFLKMQAIASLTEPA